MGGSFRLGVCGAAFALGILLLTDAASARTTVNRFPAIFVSASSAGIGSTVTLDFNANELDASGEVERLVIEVPNGYGVSLVHADNAVLGPASVETIPAGGGPLTEFDGHIVVMPAAVYAADAAAQACAPGNHAATWDLNVQSTKAGALSIPIAVDRYYAGGLQLVICFDAEHAKNLEVSGIEFRPSDVFANPQTPGRYLFDSTATPFTSTGMPNTAYNFEMRAYEDLPAALSVKASYRRATKTLIVSGSLTTGGGPHQGETVQVWASKTTNSNKSKLVGTTETVAGGKYAVTKKLAIPPRYLFTATVSTAYAVCSGESPDPGGCASYTVDYVSSVLVAVKTK